MNLPLLTNKSNISRNVLFSVLSLGMLFSVVFGVFAETHRPSGIETVGIVSPELEETYVRDGIQYQSFFHMEKVRWEALSNEHDFSLVYETAATADGRIRAIDELIEEGVDAVVLNYMDPEFAKRAADRLAEAGIPSVAHGIEPAAGLRIPVIAYDNREAGYRAGIAAAQQYEEMSRITSPRIFLITSDTDSAVHTERSRGFVEGVQEILPDAYVSGRLYDNGTTDSTKARLLEGLEEQGQAEIFFATSDYRGMGALRAIRLSVPDPEGVVLATAGGSELSMTMVQSTYDPWKVVSAFDIDAFVRTAYDLLAGSTVTGSSGEDPEGLRLQEPRLVGVEVFREPSFELAQNFVKRNYGYETWMPYCGLIDSHLRRNKDIPSDLYSRDDQES